ncbi:twin-arginine translocase TatA/TatE family subunit [Synoicihabitans lomoniglobus]|uniref:Sec-independent protein translocase protein TatA n=1 Tax=Synoicihabitans lomoniglobus TaxID=2909285 RepID=A0AAE9ZUG2_9BACT|nr:twin-arginine translocase TatA/TatE family subunit [Opitutaceae bacterium LMO-M01]WED63506.1 twin-arginine translocase TatA/TatE family subunit [Opitutaceae bacterium LMO-M01]
MNFPALFAIGPLGTTEVLVLLFIVLLLFGAKKLPELARGLGKAKNEFQKASDEAKNEFNAADEEPTKPLAKTPESSGTPGNN